MTDTKEFAKPKEIRTDNRMNFLRLIDDKEARDYRAEYEFASEVRITGQFEYSNKDLIMRFISLEPNRDGLLKYILSVAAPAAYKREPFKTSEDGYYFEGGHANEILSLASLFLKCRMFPVSYTFRDRGLDSPPMTKWEYDLIYPTPNKTADKKLFDETTRSFNSLNDFFDKVRRLPENLHHDFANAVRLYALALKEVGTNDQQAYIHLISAIEILSKNQELGHAQDTLKGILAKITLILEGEPQDTKNELENLLKQRKSQMKFIVFIQEYAGTSVVERPATGAVEHRIDKVSLPNDLKKIYRARSAYLHAGIPMYLSMPGITGVNDAYDSSYGQSIDNRSFLPENKLPNVSFFENLTRECLLNYLEKNIQ